MKGPDWGLAGAGTTVKKAAMRRMRFYPSHFRTVDLRLLVARMQQGGIQDWSVVKFVGTDRAYAMVEEGQRQETERPPPLE